jgi:hypothetical protein
VGVGVIGKCGGSLSVSWRVCVRGIGVVAIISCGGSGMRVAVIMFVIVVVVVMVHCRSRRRGRRASRMFLFWKDAAACICEPVVDLVESK